MPFPIKAQAAMPQGPESPTGPQQLDNASIVKQAIEKSHPSRRNLNHPLYFGDKPQKLQ